MMVLSTAMWDVTRASAFVAFACYTVSVAWGISLTARSFRPPVAPQFDYHRFVAVLGFAPVLVHVGTLARRQYADVDPVTLVGGGGASLAVRAGVVAMWLALALPVSFHLKQRFKLISQQFWRRFHYFGYAVWALALVHGMTGDGLRLVLRDRALRLERGADRRRGLVALARGAAEAPSSASGRPALGGMSWP